MRWQQGTHDGAVGTGAAERASFDAFYAATYGDLLALARALSPDLHAAEDLTQESYERALDQWESIRDPHRWVRRVLVNQSRSLWRRRYAERRALARLGREPVDEAPDLALDTVAFWERVRGLPRQQAAAIALFYVDRCSTAEIAALLRCAESTVRVHLTRARRTLATQMEELHD